MGVILALLWYARDKPAWPTRREFATLPGTACRFSRACSASALQASLGTIGPLLIHLLPTVRHRTAENNDGRCESAPDWLVPCSLLYRTRGPSFKNGALFLWSATCGQPKC